MDAVLLASRILNALDYVGVMGVELFVTPQGLIVNEIAPRVHNSGHWTQAGCAVDQFEQHIRAILDLPLGNTANIVSSVMVNLVGKEGYQGPVHYQNMDHILAMDGVSPNIYGKKETRPFRKMGHVTIVHPKLAYARQLAEQVKESIEVISK